MAGDGAVRILYFLLYFAVCLKLLHKIKVTNINIRELVFKIANAIFSYQLFKVECVLVKANELF